MFRLFIALALFGVPLEAAPFVIGVPQVAESAAEQAANLSRNVRALERLQKAAGQCSSMRLVLAESAGARVRRPVELGLLSPQEQEQMRGLISRMKPVKTAPAGEFALPHVVRLELLGQGGQELAGVDYMDVAPEGMVSPQGYAAGSRFVLQGSDATAWHLLMRAEHARAIAHNPAPTRMSTRGPRLSKAPEPPAPEPEPEYNPFEQEYYHKNCTRQHKGHKHKSRNHYCTHPQH